MSQQPESAAMAAFIRERQAGLIERAITAIKSCGDHELAGEAHRLAGTLGTFDLPDGHDAMRQLEHAVTRPDVTARGIQQARADTLAGLEEIAGKLVDPEQDVRPR